MKAIFSKERLGHAFVSFLLCIGLILPAFFLLQLQTYLLTSIIAAVVYLLVFTFFSNQKVVISICGIALLLLYILLQFFLPPSLFFGGWFEVIKAFIFHFNDVPGAILLFARNTSLFLAFLISFLSFCCTNKNVGVVPAASLVIALLIYLWTKQQMNLLWLASPSLISLLLIVAEKRQGQINHLEVFPLSAIIVAIAILVLPSNVAFKPLYDASSKLKQTITDYFFFTEPRNVFNLGNYGYYPLGNNRLGGPIQPSQFPILMVQTNNNLYLRGVVKDEYTGLSWRDNISGQRYLLDNPILAEKKADIFNEDVPTDLTKNITNLLNPQNIPIQVQSESSSTLFVPSHFENITFFSDMIAYFNDSSEVFITRDLKKDDQYIVSAPILDGSNSELGAIIDAVPKGEDHYYQKITDKYLQLPDHLESKVYLDLNNIISNYSTPYDKANAIMRHLQRYYTYTLTPDTPPDNQDFVTYFLYISKEGYCTYFASAMTVFARMAGLPARYVEGFLAKPTADGFAYVTGESAHAWTEIYFEGFGWVPFDATPGELDNNQKNQQPPSPSPSPSPSPTPPPENQENTPPPPEIPPENNPEQDPENNPLTFWLWLIAILVLILGISYWVWKRSPSEYVKKYSSPTEILFMYGNAVFLILSIRKQALKNAETPLRFAMRMDRNKIFNTAIVPLWRSMANCRYSQRLPDKNQLNQARDIYKIAYRSLNLKNKIAFHFQLCFNKNAYHVLEKKIVHQKTVPPFIPRPKVTKTKTKRK